jgi:hypothetical protein
LLANTASDLNEFNDGNGQFDVQLRFAHYKTPILSGEEPLFTEDFNLLFRNQLLAERCDVSVLSTDAYTAFQEYEVTKDDLAFPSVTPSVATSALPECVVTTTLQIMQAGSTPAVWNDYDPNAASDYPFIATYDDTTKEATVGLTYPVDQTAMSDYRIDNEFRWVVHMRYYSAIDQANPTTDGQISDEFTVTITELQYDPCNDNTLTGDSSVADYHYVWTEDMPQNEQYVDL